MAGMDRVTLEILSSKFTATAEEMGITLQRTGRTIYVKETADFGTALVTRGGEFFGFPQRIGVIGFVGLSCKVVIDQFPDLAPGDVILTNDPYTSGGLATHLPDLHLLKPYFADGKLICFGWCFIHSADIGGKVPTSISPNNTSIYQEGVALPPVKLLKAGKLNDEIVAVYKANCRTPELNWGDVQAMLASLDVAEKRVAELVDDYGTDTILAAQEEVLAYSERQTRQVLRSIPDGTYDFWDYLDQDAGGAVPLRVRLAMTVSDGLIELDFSGSDAEANGPFNVPTHGGVHPWIVLRIIAFAHSYGPEIVLNAGMLRNISVRVPERTLLNPVKPAPVGIRASTGLRAYDVVNGALARACPEKLTACPSGTVIPVVLVEPPVGKAEPKVSVVQFLVGATGARDGADGMDGRDPGLSSMANNPIEIVESEASVRILDYGIRPDTGGAGRWRGGCSQYFRFRVEGKGCSVFARGLERMRFSPWGIAGGQPGANLELWHTDSHGERRQLRVIDELIVASGDIIEVGMPGGGGYGDPFEREPHAVLRDVKLGFVSKAHAAEAYGVVVEAGAIDKEQTKTLRLRTKAVLTAFAFGPERVHWESVFTDERQTAIAEHLRELSRELRERERHRLYGTVSPLLTTLEGRSLSFAEILKEPELRAFDLATTEVENHVG